MIIDSHCHLTHERLLHLGGAAAVAARAKEAGVAGMMTICCRISDEFPQILAAAEATENVWCTVGTHPHEAGDTAEQGISASEIARISAGSPKVVAIGETGLDYYYRHASREDQHENFRKHLQACLLSDLPVVVHSREAEDDTIRIIREEGAGAGGRLKGVMHCFSSKRALAEKALEEGFFISFSGILTFKNASELREIAKDIPLERLLVETDAPYLAPEPVRKAINEPALIVNTLKVLAEIKGTSEAEMAAITRDNFFALFTKASDAYVQP